ncbi:MAG: 16S rRNA (guanine(527)-N(7))-methyltransferase RsmG [Terracoccus sp.]
MELIAVPPTPAQATAIFGDRLPLAERFVAILADTGIAHGLIGPREAPRLWDRHVLNCAVAHRAIPPSLAGARQKVADVGSGAGLPGLALAIARPDLEIHLIEPLTRRTGWLSGTIATLGIYNVVVHTARAESMWDRLTVPYVTARAVSGIVQLAGWTLPLLAPGGSVLALKGSRAQSELSDNQAALTQMGVVDASVETFGEELAEPTTILRLTIGATVDRRRFAKHSSSSAGSARRRIDRPGGSRASSRSDRSGRGIRGGRDE